MLADPDAKPYVALEAHLMLAKLHYLSADFDRAVIDVDNAKLERNDIQFQTLRTLRLVAEAYAIKGKLFSYSARNRLYRRDHSTKRLIRDDGEGTKMLPNSVYFGTFSFEKHPSQIHHFILV